MIEEKEAEELMSKLISLRNNYNETNKKEDLIKLQRHEKTCIEKFKYLVTMKTYRYKSFSNYEDLNQEGLEALVKSMKNYNPELGCYFWWAHKYIDTRISRSANLHTAIRYPLKFAKENIPHKETVLPTIVEERYCPDKELENCQTVHTIESAMKLLSERQREIIKLAYGFDGEKPMSVAKICKQLNIPRSSCVKEMNSAISLLKDQIKL